MENNVRLIDANKLMERYGEPCHSFTDIIEDMPTIDAVEVVRCKDCKYARSGYGESYVLCTAHPTFLHYSPKEGFCYRGKKMDGGETNAE